MKKTYLILLSSLIACSSWSMNSLLETPEKEIERAMLRAGEPMLELHNNILENVKELKKKNELSQEKIFQAIAKQIDASADNVPHTMGVAHWAVGAEYRIKFSCITRVILNAQKVYNFFGNQDGTKVLVLEGNGVDCPKVLSVWGELTTPFEETPLTTLKKATALHISNNFSTVWQKQHARTFQDPYINIAMNYTGEKLYNICSLFNTLPQCDDAGGVLNREIEEAGWSFTDKSLRSNLLLNKVNIRIITGQPLQNREESQILVERMPSISEIAQYLYEKEQEQK